MLLNASLIRSQLISLCKDIACSSGCKTYSAPICISDDALNIYVSSNHIDTYSDPLCSIQIPNKTQPLLIDNKCHTINNTYYIILTPKDHNIIFILIPICFLILIVLIYRCPLERNKGSLDHNPPMRD